MQILSYSAAPSCTAQAKQDRYQCWSQMRLSTSKPQIAVYFAGSATHFKTHAAQCLSIQAATTNTM